MLSSSLALVLCVAVVSPLGDRPVGKRFTTRSEVFGRNGMAATSQPLATEAALDILKRGGSAIDAALAANAVLALTEPTGCGLGGDLFAIVWDAREGKLVGLNGSGRSPRGLTRAEFEKRGLRAIPSLGPLPVSVPGCVDAWFALHGRFGKLPIAEVLAPAIRHAREGFAVTEVIAYYWQRNAGALKDFPGFAEQFMPAGRAPRKGEIFRNPNLAATLVKLAAGGRAAFYEGEIASRIAAYMKEQGGFLEVGDLAAHRSEWVEPVSTNYRGYDVWELPPNGQGIAVLQMLNLLELHDTAAMGFGSADYVHRFVEAKKLVFEDRARCYADPAFAAIAVDSLISKAYAAERAKLIDPVRAAMRYEPGPAALKTSDTIYLCTADSAGNMVSLIQSNFRGMGSGMAPTGLGFVLQDRGELFDLDPKSANAYAPGKRPFHTIIPAFVTKGGKPWLAFGVMGGDFQPLGHVQILCNLIDFGMNLQEAGDAPRFTHEGSSSPVGQRMEDGGEVSFESGFDAGLAAEIERRGHRLGDSRGNFGGYQAILWDAERGVYVGASESRKDGYAAGY